MTTIEGDIAPPRPVSTLRAWFTGFGRPPRLMGLDVARALAVLGMMAAHLLTTPELSLLDPSTWGALVHGRPAILFAVLAGISVALMTGRTRLPDVSELPAIRLGLVVRGAVIFVIGLVLELLGTPIAVILTFYGALYVIAAAFVRWRVSHLLAVAAVLSVAGPPLLALLKALTFHSHGPGAALVLFGTYPLTVWLALLLGGMAIGRMRLDRTRDRVRLLVIGVVLAAVGYGIGALGAAAGTLGGSAYPDSASSLSDGSLSLSASGGDTGPGSASGWESYFTQLGGQDPLGSALFALIAVEPHSGGTAEIVGSGGFAVAVIALCLLASAPLRWMLLPVAALGSMPLSAYSAHVLSYALIAGPGVFLDSFDMWLWSAVVLLVASTLWSILLGRGPLETLLSRLSAAVSGTPVPRSSR
ncbi:heparan-alpha-glucosaminide N-acetyltransferase domain-containing protein [Microbacterium sp.]|uniref:heparan-alpha-glucosaminide N-acetyltransferase domain-containing protein n=1 Tax=Microbacterium sp. TaxID=51671 RepID=UPI0028B1BC05|nr:heparan-alpha-glucosaminide N-acetyltransferase domain-containing protein [Microbacterium sp.]